MGENVNSLTLHPEGALYVLDGRWLLRKVTWTQNVSTYKMFLLMVNFAKIMSTMLNGNLEVEL